MNDLQKAINDTVSECLMVGIKKALESSYSNPIIKIAESVITSRESEIRDLFNNSLSHALSEDFRPELEKACAHKLAKVLISKMEGEIEKKANDLRSNPETRAKITVAIAKVIEGIQP